MRVQEPHGAERALADSNQQLHKLGFMFWYEKGSTSQQLGSFTERLLQLDVLWWSPSRNFKAKFARKRGLYGS